MAADFLIALGAANLAAGAAICFVLLVRGPIRRMAGARLAYWLWLTPLAAGVAGFLPAFPAGVAPVASPIQPLLEASFGAASDWAAPKIAATHSPGPPINLPLLIVVVWALGALTFLALTLRRQHRAMAAFGRLAAGPNGLWLASGQAGPAVVGVLRPRLVVSADFESRFCESERKLIVAHERTHLKAGHTRVNAGLAFASCINWFNPLIHIAVRCVRSDQELACDAAVVERFPDERRTYAEALLKTQIDASSPPLGCAWPSRSFSLLKERVTMLARKSPRSLPRIIGVGLISTVVLGVGVTAWAVQPPTARQPQPDAASLESPPAAPPFELLNPQQPQDAPARSAQQTMTAPAAPLEQPSVQPAPKQPARAKAAKGSKSEARAAELEKQRAAERSPLEMRRILQARLNQVRESNTARPEIAVQSPGQEGPVALESVTLTGNVIVRQGGDVLHGLAATLELAGGPLRITSNRLHVADDRQSITYSGEVTLEHGGVIYNCDEAVVKVAPGGIGHS